MKDFKKHFLKFSYKPKSDKTYKKDGIQFEQVRKKWTIEKTDPLW